MPQGRKGKKQSLLKRGLRGAKRHLGPVIKAAAKQAAVAARKELQNHGRSIGKSILKKGLRTMTGIGDYKTNSLIPGGTNSTPSFGSSTSRFRRRECLGPVVSSATIGKFDLQKFRVNPGVSTCFPWLSGLAGNYESYRPISLIFEYLPTSGMSVASTNTALGSITMASQYNPFALDPSNLIQIQGYADAVTLAPFESGLCGIECDPKQRQSETLLVRNNNVSSNGGLTINTGYDTLFDLCEFFIATEGCQAAGVKLGQLWVTYEIELANPIIPFLSPFNPGAVLHSLGAGQEYVTFFTQPYGITQTTPNNALAIHTTNADYPTLLTNEFLIDNLPIGAYIFRFAFNTASRTASNYSLAFSGTSGIKRTDGITAVATYQCPQSGPTGIVSNDLTYAITVPFNGSSQVRFRDNGGDFTPTSMDKWSISIIRIPESQSLVIPCGRFA